MKPINNKSLLAFLSSQMEKLDKKEIDVATAKAQASLAHQASTIIKNEIERARVKMEIERHNKEYNSNIELREVESKNSE
jgi:hypothetical protein